MRPSQLILGFRAVTAQWPAQVRGRQAGKGRPRIAAQGLGLDRAIPCGLNESAARRSGAVVHFGAIAPKSSKCFGGGGYPAHADRPRDAICC